MTSFDDFRSKISKEKVVEDKIAANFIFSGNLATVISVNNVNISAALSYVNNVETRDGVYTYTYSDTTLNIGDIFEWRNEHYLIADQDKMVKNVYYNKYLAFECNFSYENS
jgi:formylmethanofuran dehydrogenase subunit E-like metal-binding protein